MFNKLARKYLIDKWLVRQNNTVHTRHVIKARVFQPGVGDYDGGGHSGAHSSYICRVQCGTVTR